MMSHRCPCGCGTSLKAYLFSCKESWSALPAEIVHGLSGGTSSCDERAWYVKRANEFLALWGANEH